MHFLTCRPLVFYLKGPIKKLQKSNASTKLLYEFKMEEEEEIPTRQDDFSPENPI